MATAGYKLEFESEEVARRALVLCNEVEKATGWHDRAALHRASVCVRTDTAVDAAEFGIDEFDEGDNLFLEICFCLAQCMPQTYFEGMCRYQDDAGNWKTKRYPEGLVRRPDPSYMPFDSEATHNSDVQDAGAVPEQGGCSAGTSCCPQEPR